MTRLSTLVAFFVFCYIITAGQAQAEQKGQIELKMVVEQEVTVTNEDGEKTVERTEAKLVLPGDEVIYTITYRNIGEEEATNVVITNPIPQHMIYKAGTALGDGTEIVYSVDGSHFDLADKLKVKLPLPDAGERPATVQDYSHIRWILKTPVAPGKTGEVSYRARLE